MGIKIEGMAGDARLRSYRSESEVLHFGVLMGSPQGIRDQITKLWHEYNGRMEPERRRGMADAARRAEVPYGFPDDDGWVPPRKARTLADAIRDGNAMAVKKERE